MNNWYYAQNKKKVGPVTIADLKVLLESGKLRPTDMLLQEGAQKWVAAGSVTDLATDVPPTPQDRRPVGPTPRRSRALDDLRSFSIWMIHEIREICAATFAQTSRLIGFCRDMWRSRALSKASTHADIILGRRLHEISLGDAEIREQISVLDAKGSGGANVKERKRALESQRAALLSQLAAFARAQASPLAKAEEEFRKAKDAHDAVQKQEADTNAARKGFWPSGLAGWRRTGIGFGTIIGLFACAMMFAFSARPAPPIDGIVDNSAHPLTSPRTEPDLTKSLAHLDSSLKKPREQMDSIRQNAKEIEQSYVNRAKAFDKQIQTENDKRIQDAKSKAAENQTKNEATAKSKADVVASHQSKSNGGPATKEKEPAIGGAPKKTTVTNLMRFDNLTFLDEPTLLVEKVVIRAMVKNTKNDGSYLLEVEGPEGLKVPAAYGKDGNRGPGEFVPFVCNGVIANRIAKVGKGKAVDLLCTLRVTENSRTDQFGREVFWNVYYIHVVSAQQSKDNRAPQGKDDKRTNEVPEIALRAIVNTAGKDEMAWWINSYNKTIKNLKVMKTENALAKTENALVIGFDIDMDAWAKVPAVNECFPLLVRVFDENGQYLTHFTTAEGFTAHNKIYDDHYEVYQRFARLGLKPPVDVRRPTLLQAKENIFFYGVNCRDMRDTTIIEVGFFESPRR